MIGGKRIKELEDHIEQLQHKNNKLVQERFKVLEANEVMQHELKQLRAEQRQVVSTEDADLLHRELDQARLTIDELRIDLQDQTERYTTKIKSLNAELEKVTKHRDNAKHAFRRVSAKRKKNEARSA